MTTVADVRRAIAEAVAAEPPLVLVASTMEPHLLALVRECPPDARPELVELSPQ